MNTTLSSERSQKIAALNDQFRTTGVGGLVLVTAGVQALGSDGVAEALEVVRSFDSFTEDVESEWRAVSRRRGRSRHSALRTGRASFPASGSPCAA